MSSFESKTYDYVVIGSGFGGSVSAMRLAEKGYDVLIIEKGKHWKPEDFPKSSWNFRKYFWFPSFRCFGILQLNFFKKAFILTGVGVGGGSLVYANTHMIPDENFWKSPIWAGIQDWKKILEPFYEKARYMLGSIRYDKSFLEDEVFEKVAHSFNAHMSYRSVDYIGVNFNTESSDPYFDGQGPPRKPCIECAGCMVGCRHHAKNSLDMNYLWFAQKFGAVISAESKVNKIQFENGIYEIKGESQTDWLFKKKFRVKAKGIVVSAGVLGTLELLLKQKYVYKTLPLLSEKLGDNILTNSEMIGGVGYTGKKINHGIAISKIFKPDKHTTVELCKYPNNSGTMYKLGVPAVGPGSPLVRSLALLKTIIKNPFQYPYNQLFRSASEQSIILLIMQSLNNSMTLRIKKKWWRHRLEFHKENQSVPSFIPIGQEVIQRYAKEIDGMPMNAFSEVLFGMSTTAHIMGGCPMGIDKNQGVVDSHFRVWDYPNFFILDGSIIPANLGVNPSLTITALSEYAMDHIPNKASQNQTK